MLGDSQAQQNWIRSRDESGDVTMHSQILGWPDLIRFLLASLVLLGTREFLFRRRK